MITFFTTARPFHGHIGMIQANAIQSWLELCPPCEVLLLGNDEGTAEIARKFGLKHIPDIACNEYGTPLISSLFQAAEDHATNKYLCQINADIMLTDDFLTAIKKICSSHARFLVSGQRRDVDINEPWDFVQPNCQDRIRKYVEQQGKLHPPTGLDYFVFPKGLWGDLPPFAIGRESLDNWLIYRARSLRVPVIDATSAITAIHQNHDYVHFENRVAKKKSLEAQRNRELAGGFHHLHTLRDSTHRLTEDGVRFSLSNTLRLHSISSQIVLGWRYWLWFPFLSWTRPMRDRLRLRRAKRS
jgi:hypothetical protein